MLNNDLEVFIALVESGSFSNAARHLRTTQATVSRRLKALEESLSMALINRDTRNFEITIAGNKLYQGLKTQQNELDQLIDQLKHSEQEATGKLRLSMPVGFTFEIISPYLPAFLRQNKGIELELHYESHEVDLLKDNFDLAIIDYTPKHQSILLRRLAIFEAHVYCSSSYLERYGMPKHPRDMTSENHLMVNFLKRDYTIPTMIDCIDKNAGEFTIPNPARFFTNNALHNKAMVKSGEIIVFGWDFLFKEELKQGTIIKLFPQITFAKISVSLIRTNNKPSIALELLIKFIDECFARLSNDKS